MPFTPELVRDIYRFREEMAATCPPTYPSRDFIDFADPDASVEVLHLKELCCDVLLRKIDVDDAKMLCAYCRSYHVSEFEEVLIALDSAIEFVEAENRGEIQ